MPATQLQGKVWVCPECGHGSPEPRDRQAHLDAHRQLQQFFREWDAAVVADAGAEHRGTLRWLAYGVAAFLVVCVAALAFVLTRPDRGLGGPNPAVPIPGVQLPGDYGPAVGAGEPTRVTSSAPAPADHVSGGPPPAPATGTSPAARGSAAPAPTATAPSPTPAQQTDPPPAREPQRHLATVDLLGIRLTVL